MEDNKSKGSSETEISFISNGRPNNVNSRNIPNTTNKSSITNQRLISEGRPNQSTSNVRSNGYNRTYNPNIVNKKNSNIPINNNYRRPSNLTPPRYNYNNDSENENEESESRISQTRRKVDDITGKVVKAKKTISFFSKYKFIIIGCCVAIVLVILFMFLMMVVELDGDNKDDNTSTTSYDKFVLNTNGNGNGDLWWPIGSSEVTTSIEINGNKVDFRSGTPVYTSLTSGYTTDGRDNHYAIDIAASGNIYLIAMADGEISYISNNRDEYYNEYPNNNYSCSKEAGEKMIQINIKYNNGYESKYLHLKEKSIPNYLKKGSKVYQGQVIGMMGNTGCSTGQHLHYALLINNQAVNPDNYIFKDNPRPLPEGITKKSEYILKESYERIKEKEELGQDEVTIGGDNQQTVCLTFKDYGYPDTGVAALMVNIQHESNFNPKAENELGCVGLVQWCFGRQVNIKSKYGTNWGLINNQLEHIQNELISGYRYVYDDLNGSGSTSEKTYRFCMNYEVPGESYCISRKNSNKNNQYLKYVQNGCK